MGKNNSSKCRVKPLMNYLLVDCCRLSKMLEKLNINTSKENFHDDCIYYDGHKGEKSLKPSCEYLCKLIENLPDNEYAIEKIKISPNGETKKKRIDLINCDSKRDEAINKIKEEYPTKIEIKGYMYLEGNTKPDVFIETDDKIIVIEGKWTEKNTTDSTTFVENRNQMVRHLHGALNYRNLNCPTKEVYGFYIVSDSFAQDNKISCDDFRKKLENQFGIEGLVEQILSSYKGFITWEMIEDMFPEVANEWKKFPE